MSDTQPMTDAELNAIRERAERATSGPWSWEDNGYMETGIGEMALANETDCILEIDAGAMPADKAVAPGDRDFIAHARADIPALLAEVDRLRGKLSRIDGVLAKCDRGSRDGWPGALLVIADIVEGDE